MSLLLVEGFEGFGTSTGVAPQPTGIVGRAYSSVVNEHLMDVMAGRLAGRSLAFGTSNNQLRANFSTTDATLVVGFALKISTLVSDPVFLTLYAGSTEGMKLRVRTSGIIEVWRDAVFMEASSAVLTADTWYYIEFKVKCDNTVGTYEVRVGGVNVLSASGVDTQVGAQAYHNTVQLGFLAGFGLLYFDDWYVCDSIGSVNNDFLGNCRVDAIFPNGDDTAGWDTASGAGDHYLDVDEVLADDDTSYVEDATTDHKDLYDYAAMPVGRGAIKGLEIKTMCRETDAENFDIVTPIKSGVTETDDSAQSIGTTDYVVKKRVSETDPNTSTAWTKTTVDAAKFGVKVG